MQSSWALQQHHGHAAITDFVWHTAGDNYWHGTPIVVFPDNVLLEIFVSIERIMAPLNCLTPYSIELTLTLSLDLQIFCTSRTLTRRIWVSGQLFPSIYVDVGYHSNRRHSNNASTVAALEHVELACDVSVVITGSE